MSSSDTATDDKVSDMTLSASLGDSKKGTPKRVGTLNCLWSTGLSNSQQSREKLPFHPLG